MARNEQHIALTLWPFLDILSCLAGALTVIIATVLVTELVSDPVLTRPVNEKLTEFKRENEEKRAEIARYQNYLQERRRQQSDWQNAREKYLLTQQDLEDRLRYQAMLVALLRRKEDLEAQIQALRNKYAQQESEMGKFPVANQGRASTNVSDRIEVQFTGRGQGLKPVFVECTENGIVIRNGSKMSFVRAQNIAASDEYRRTLKKIQSTLGGTVIFLIRPTGIAAFEEAEDTAEQAGVRNGKLPIPGEGVIDLGPYGGQATGIP